MKVTIVKDDNTVINSVIDQQDISVWAILNMEVRKELIPEFITITTKYGKEYKLIYNTTVLDLIITEFRKRGVL